MGDREKFRRGGDCRGRVIPNGWCVVETHVDPAEIVRRKAQYRIHKALVLVIDDVLSGAKDPREIATRLPADREELKALRHRLAQTFIEQIFANAAPVLAPSDGEVLDAWVAWGIGEGLFAPETKHEIPNLLPLFDGGVPTFMDLDEETVSGAAGADAPPSLRSEPAGDSDATPMMPEARVVH